MNIIVLINELFLIAIGLIGFRTKVALSKIDDPLLKGTHLGMAMICLVWSTLYAFVFLGEVHLIPIDSEFVRNWLVRPLITITLGLIAAGSVARKKRNGF